MTTEERAKYKANLEARHKTFEGFGRKLSCAEWARTFGLSRMTVWRYLQNGLTPEEIAEIRGLTID